MKAQTITAKVWVIALKIIDKICIETHITETEMNDTMAA